MYLVLIYNFEKCFFFLSVDLQDICSTTYCTSCLMVLLFFFFYISGCQRHCGWLSDEGFRPACSVSCFNSLFFFSTETFLSLYTVSVQCKDLSNLRLALFSFDNGELRVLLYITVAETLNLTFRTFYITFIKNNNTTSKNKVSNLKHKLTWKPKYSIVEHTVTDALSLFVIAYGCDACMLKLPHTKDKWILLQIRECLKVVFIYLFISPVSSWFEPDEGWHRLLWPPHWHWLLWRL